MKMAYMYLLSLNVYPVTLRVSCACTLGICCISPGFSQKASQALIISQKEFKFQIEI